jgi:RNA polymerase sigma-70 factor, ECF subfamily
MDPAALDAARAAWPELRLEPAKFAAHAAACGARPQHLADLYLACAAAAGDPAALRAFDERLLPAVDPVVRRIDASPAFLDEVRQLVRVRLLVADGAAAPRIAGYRGAGPLVGWLRVAAVRVALNLKRGARAAVDVDDVIGEIVTREADPELRHLKALYRAELADALRAALAALPDRDRAVLRLHYVDGLRLAPIAALYKVSESTMSRWVTRAEAAVADDARRRLADRLALSGSAADSVARMVRSNLDLSIGKLLA